MLDGLNLLPPLRLKSSTWTDRCGDRRSALPSCSSSIHNAADIIMVQLANVRLVVEQAAPLSLECERLSFKARGGHVYKL